MRPRRAASPDPRRISGRNLESTASREVAERFARRVTPDRVLPSHVTIAPYRVSPLITRVSRLVSLTPGTRIGPYEIAALIGTGGMGEVYRATDIKLKRQVAIKVLPVAVAQDAERLARFQREAEILARLHHPNIAAIHGLEEADGIKALVMELVEGPTLAERITRGPIPVKAALTLARQIVDALDAAHEKGIVHRDLKPGNIKITPEGTVKVLDFGLAKDTKEVADVTTIAAVNTRDRVILGTAGV